MNQVITKGDMFLLVLQNRYFIYSLIHFPFAALRRGFFFLNVCF